MRSSRLSLFLIVFFCSWGVWAQSQRAQVVNQRALVYKDADFDAPILTEVKAGQFFAVSVKKRGPFYKIRLKAGVTGWIADNDVRVSSGMDSTKAVPLKTAKKPEPPPRPLKPFYVSRYRGPTVSYLTYNENTMGQVRSQNMPFYGFKVAGPNTMFSGDFRTDAEFLVHFGAPDYYQTATGHPASGWIFVTDFIFETAMPQSKWHMVTFGFGPMFKYSHLEVGLTESGKEINYSLDDMALGAVFDLGLAFRTGKYALRFNTKYYWEKTKYWGFGVTFGFPF